MRLAAARGRRAIMVLAACTSFMGNVARAESPAPRPAEDPGIFVKQVSGLSAAFVMGADVSSVLSLEKSGVVFRNRAGEPQDLFQTLAENGVNSIRIRVWNHPFSDSGVGYGGGNCDIDRAIEIGKRATARGLWVYLDFHYSDFWADPGKQRAPLAWETLSLEDKADALYAYTRDSLLRALEAGVDVRMVQLGNETVTAMCGETNWNAIGTLLRAGSRAIRDASKKVGRHIDIAIHFTNPEKAGAYERFARILNAQKVDYDVFASSWYPYWHGTQEEFIRALRDAARISGKKVLCAEVAYAYTYDDGDGFPNAVSRDSVFPRQWPVTVQGQADAIRCCIEAVAAIGDAGMGVYYWEPAWIPVPGDTKGEREALWDRWGSGWATRAAAEYDKKDAGAYFGGSGWDNQALFSFEGIPLDSLAVWKLARTGATTALRPDSAAEQMVRVRIGDPIKLPASVEVIMNDGSRETLPVRWDQAAETLAPKDRYGELVPIDGVGSRGVGEYALFGVVESGGRTVRAFARVYAVEQNYVENPSFEDDDISMWRVVADGTPPTELGVQDKKADAKTGSRSFHFWSRQKIAFRVEQTITGLRPGVYKFSVAIHGGDAGKQNIHIYARTGIEELRQSANVDGWRNFREPTIPRIRVTDGTVTVGAYISCDANGWGSLDDFILAPVEQE